MAIATRLKKPSHAKKRTAGHHRHGKQYVKTYLPFMPVLLILCLGYMLNLHWNHAAVLGSSLDISNSQLLLDTNSQRIDSQEQPLILDTQLAAAAQAKANDMVQNNYWAHKSPQGKSPWTFISASGYQYQSAGENLAYGFKNADEVIAGWMNSPEHRANILGKDYQAVGFGIASSRNFVGKGPQTIIVAEYAEPTSAVANISFRVDGPLPSSAAVKGDQTELASRNVARIQLLTHSHDTVSLVVISALSGAALMIFLIRYGYRIHRVASRGEAFVAHHLWLDVIFALIITAGYILTRSEGLIR